MSPTPSATSFACTGSPKAPVKIASSANSRAPARLVGEDDRPEPARDAQVLRLAHRDHHRIEGVLGEELGAADDHRDVADRVEQGGDELRRVVVAERDQGQRVGERRERDGEARRTGPRRRGSRAGARAPRSCRRRRARRCRPRAGAARAPSRRAGLHRAPRRPSHPPGSLWPPRRPLYACRAMRAAELDLDLDVFAGPFDLLMTVVLREEVALAEVELGEIVIAYLEQVEERGELDLEAATEFLVLIASLLELKSRLLLPRRRRRRSSSRPRRRPRSCSRGCSSTAATATPPRTWPSCYADGSGYLYRSAPLPPELRRVALDAARPELRPRAARGLDRRPAAPAAGARHQPHPPDGLARAAAAGAARAARRRALDRLRRSASATRTSSPRR